MLEEADTMEAGEAASASKVTESAKTKNTVTKKIYVSTNDRRPCPKYFVTIYYYLFTQSI